MQGKSLLNVGRNEARGLSLSSEGGGSMSQGLDVAAAEGKLRQGRPAQAAVQGQVCRESLFPEGFAGGVGGHRQGDHAIAALSPSQFDTVPWVGGKQGEARLALALGKPLLDHGGFEDGGAA